MENNIPLVEKYRPSTLDGIVLTKNNKNLFNNILEEDIFPNILLYGPPGTGKTSTILAAAKDMYGQGYKNMTLELNASDDRGIDVVRNEIKEFAGTRRLFSSGIKLIVLDEEAMMYLPPLISTPASMWAATCEAISPRLAPSATPNSSQSPGMSEPRS